MSLLRLKNATLDKSEFHKIFKKIISKAVQICPEITIYIFGSYTKDQFTAASDLDLSIIIPDLLSEKEFLVKLKKEGPLSDWPLDLVIVNKSRFENRKDYGGICFEVYHSGIELYPKWNLL